MMVEAGINSYYFTYESCRISGYNSVGSHIVSDYARSTDHSILFHGHTGQNGDTGSYPCAPTYSYRLTGDNPTVVEVMIVGNQLNIGCNHRIVFNSDSSCRHHQTATLYHHISSYLHLIEAHSAQRGHDTLNVYYTTKLLASRHKPLPQIPSDVTQNHEKSRAISDNSLLCE